MKRASLFVSLAIVLCTSFSCNDPYGVAAKLAQDVAVSVNQADATVDQLRVAGAITPTEERSVLGYLNSVNTFDGQYIGCVQAAHGSTVAGGFTKCATTLLTSLGDPTTLTSLHIVNPQSQAKVTAIAQGISSIVSSVMLALGGK